MGYSPLCSKIVNTGKYTKVANKVNKNIVIHHMAWIIGAEQCAIYHRDKISASANYYIGKDGEIVGSVDEGARAWTSGNYAIDSCSVTFEVSNCKGAPNWEVSDKVLDSVINLCVDICKRNGIKELRYTGDKSGNLQMHCWYQPTACPGPYLKTKFGYIANEVNKRMGNANTVVQANGNRLKGYILNGVDYSKVFDADFYGKTWQDVAKVYGTAPNMLWQHFTDYGMKEGRVGCISFNPKKYKEYNADLEMAFGENMEMYYWHYCKYGRYEQRVII